LASQDSNSFFGRVKEITKIRHHIQDLRITNPTSHLLLQPAKEKKERKKEEESTLVLMFDVQNDNNMDNILSDTDVHTDDDGSGMESNGLRNEIGKINTHHIFVSRFEREENNLPIGSSLPLSAATINGIQHLRPRPILPPIATAANIALTIKSTSYDEYDGESSSSLSSSSADNISSIDGGEDSSCYVTADEGAEEEEIIFMTDDNISLSPSSSSSSVSTNSIAGSCSVRNGLLNNYDWDDLISFEEGWKGIVANAMTRSISTSTSTSLASSSRTTLSNDSDDDDDDDDDDDEETKEEDKNVTGKSFASDEAIVPRNIRTVLGGTATYTTGTTNTSCTTDDDELTEDTSSLFLLLRQGFEPEIEITFFDQNSSDPTIMAIIANKENCDQLNEEEEEEEEDANVIMEAIEGKTEPDKNSNRNDVIKSSIPTPVLPTESVVTLVEDEDDDDNDDDDDDVTKWTEETIDDDDDDYFFNEDEEEDDSLLPIDNSEEEEEILVIFEDVNGGADDTYYYGIDYDIIDSNQASSDGRSSSSSWIEEEIFDDESNNEELTTVSSGSETNEEVAVTAVATTTATTSNNCDTIINKIEKDEVQLTINNQLVEAKYCDLSNRSVLQGDDEGKEQSIDHNENTGERNVDSTERNNNSATVIFSSTFDSLQTRTEKTSKEELCERSYVTTNDYHKDDKDNEAFPSLFSSDLLGVKSLVSFWDTVSNKRKLHRLVERSIDGEYSNIEGNEGKGRGEEGLLDEDTYKVKNGECTTGFSDEDRMHWDQQDHYHCSNEKQKDDDADITNVVILGRKGKHDDDEGALATLHSIEEGSYGKEGNEGEVRGEEGFLNQEHHCSNEKQMEVSPCCLHRENGDDSSAVNINEVEVEVEVEDADTDADADADTTNAVILGRKGNNYDDDSDDGTLATLHAIEEGSYGKDDGKEEGSFFGKHVVDPKQFLWVMITIVFVVCFLSIFCVILYGIVF